MYVCVCVCVPMDAYARDAYRQHANCSVATVYIHVHVGVTSVDPQCIHKILNTAQDTSEYVLCPNLLCMKV